MLRHEILMEKIVRPKTMKNNYDSMYQIKNIICKNLFEDQHRG